MAINFTEEFLQSLSYAETAEEHHALLQAIIDYYVVPKNKKEHPLLAVLSMVYRRCPDSFFLYVADYEAKERDFMIMVKLMFERGDISENRMNEWQGAIEGNVIPIQSYKVKIS